MEAHAWTSWLVTLALAAAAGTASAQNVPAGAAQPVRLDNQISLSAPNGCHYQATVHGSARPSREHATTSEQLYDQSDVTVDAQLVCPNATTIHTTDRVVNGGPMSLAKLEAALEMRGAIPVVATGQRCLYVPDFHLSTTGVTGSEVAYLCPSTHPAARGGGPKGL